MAKELFELLGCHADTRIFGIDPNLTSPGKPMCALVTVELKVIENFTGATTETPPRF
jgi:hypothetical protein